jgi:hypothetical protein
LCSYLPNLYLAFRQRYSLSNSLNKPFDLSQDLLVVCVFLARILCHFFVGLMNRDRGCSGDARRHGGDGLYLHQLCSDFWDLDQPTAMMMLGSCTSSKSKTQTIGISFATSKNCLDKTSKES